MKKNITNEKELNKKVITSNLLWRLFERFGVYIISFIISVILARLLEPEIYGVVALMTVVISFLDVFVTGGFANSLIYDKNATEKDFNTILWFNICFSIVCYLILFFIAPLIANYYETPILTGLIRVSGISLLVSGIKSLQYAYIAKNLQFKRYFVATIGGTIVSGITGVIMAFLGCGPWALVAQGVINNVIDTIILCFVVKWKPKFEFSFLLLKKHLSFGWKILLYKIIYNISNNIRQLFIGKKYSKEDLAYYNKGKTYPNIIGQNVYNSVNSVMFPVYSKLQDDKKRFNEVVMKALRVNMFIMLPICLGLFSVSETFIYLLIGEKWLPCVPFVKIFCIVILFNSIEAILSNAPMALGKSTASMILGIIECFINIVLLVIAIPFGVMAIGYSMIAASFLNCVIYFIYMKKITGLSFKTFLCESFDSIVSCIVMGIIVYSISTLNLPFYIIFILQILVGVVSYYFLSKIIKNPALDYCLSILKDMFKKRKSKKQ